MPVIAVRGITKHFGSIQALRGVDLEVNRGEVVGLVGDNGAGKSTLVNILSGVLQPNSGTILIREPNDQEKVALRAQAGAPGRPRLGPPHA